MTKSGSHPVFHRCSDGKMRRTYNANYMRRIGWLRLSCPVCDFDKVYVNVMAANRPEAVRDVRKALCERRAIINGRYVKAQRSGNLHQYFRMPKSGNQLLGAGDRVRFGGFPVETFAGHQFKP